MQIAKYFIGQRVVHWLIALLVLTLVPVGLWMASRSEAGIFDDLTNTLFAWHKAIGFTVLLLMILRIALKLRFGTPQYPADMRRPLVIAAKSLHHLIYLLLVAVPLVGWAGVTAFPALITLGGYDLPAFPMIPQDQDLATRLFGIHGILAITLAVLVGGHVLAALRHLVVKKDGIFERMWFGGRR